jgi:hypothetical protein
MASFIRINPGDSIKTRASATSQAFYIIRGEGVTQSEHGEVNWSQGDLFVIPQCESEVNHIANEDTAIYWITDEPLLQYLGVKPCVKKFKPTLFRKERMLAEVERIKHQPGAEHRYLCILSTLFIKYKYQNFGNFTEIVWVFYWETKSRRTPLRLLLTLFGLF